MGNTLGPKNRKKKTKNPQTYVYECIVTLLLYFATRFTTLILNFTNISLTFQPTCVLYVPKGKLMHYSVTITIFNFFFFFFLIFYMSFESFVGLLTLQRVWHFLLVGWLMFSTCLSFEALIGLLLQLEETEGFTEWLP